MSLFYCHLTGVGDGCDYTIGCNHTFFRMKARSIEEAKEEIPGKLGDHGEDRIESVTIYEVKSRFVFDVEDYNIKQEEKAAALQIENIEKNERELLEKLKDKYE